MREKFLYWKTPPCCCRCQKLIMKLRKPWQGANYARQNTRPISTAPTAITYINPYFLRLPVLHTYTFKYLDFSPTFINITLISFSNCSRLSLYTKIFPTNRKPVKSPKDGMNLQLATKALKLI